MMALGLSLGIGTGIGTIAANIMENYNFQDNVSGFHAVAGSIVNTTVRALDLGQEGSLPEELRTQEVLTFNHRVTAINDQIQRAVDEDDEDTSEAYRGARTDLVETLVETLVRSLMNSVEKNSAIITQLQKEVEACDRHLAAIEHRMAVAEDKIVALEGGVAEIREGQSETKEEIREQAEKIEENAATAEQQGIAIHELKQIQIQIQQQQQQQQQEHRDVAQNSTCRTLLHEKVVDCEQQQEDLRIEKNLQTVKVNATFGLDQVNLSKAHQQQRAAMVLQQNYEKQAMELRHRQAQVNLEANCSDEIAHLCFGKDLKLRDFADRIDNEIAALEAKKQFAIDALKSSKE